MFKKVREKLDEVKKGKDRLNFSEEEILKERGGDVRVVNIELDLFLFLFFIFIFLIFIFIILNLDKGCDITFLLLN